MKHKNKTQKAKVRGTWATYQDDKDKALYRCNIDEMAKAIVSGGWGNFPKVIGDKRAMEICLLAEAYLNFQGEFDLKELVFK